MGYLETSGRVGRLRCGMPRGYRRQNCRICERHVSACGDLSKRGKCQDCALALMEANAVGIAAHTGPFFNYWRERMAASVGAKILDDRQDAA